MKAVRLPDRAIHSTLRRWRLFEAPKQLAGDEKPSDELSDAEKHQRLRERS